MRQAGPADEAMLYALFAEERAVQLIQAMLQAPQLHALIEMQYRGQQMSYAAQFPLADNWVLLAAGGVPAGRLLLDRHTDRWRIVDLGVLRAHRGRGLATRALRCCQQQSAAAGAGLALQVAPWNPARGLYQRLGFVTERVDELAVEMMWLPAGEEAGRTGNR